MIEILISSSLLILIIYGIRTFLKGKINLHLQYALWLLVVIRLFPLGLFMGANVPKIESPISIMQSVNHLYTNLIKSDTNVTTPKEIIHNEKTDNAKSDEASTNETKSIDRNSTTANTSILIKIWYIGMAIITLWMLYVNIRFKRTIKKDRTLLTNITCKLPVYVSPGIHSPMLLMVNGKFGIYVTQSCVDDETKMEHALTHELCHYKHLDYLWSFIRCIIIITYWFNPFVWLAAILSKRDCELSCDASALKILGDEQRFSYGRTILEFVAIHNNRSNILNIAIGMSESKVGMKERIQRISKKSKMMVGTYLALVVIVVLAIITTFTTPPKDKDLSDSKENHTITEENSTTTTTDTTNDLSKLLDNDTQTQNFNNGYYYNGEQFMTPDGPIESLSDFTDDMIVNHYYGSSVWSNNERVLDDEYSKSFSKLEGFSYWIDITATKETSITIDYSTTTSDTTLKTVLILPDDTIIELKNNESNTITIPRGTSEIIIVAFDAAGEVKIKFNYPTDTVIVKKI